MLASQFQLHKPLFIDFQGKRNLLNYLNPPARPSGAKPYSLPSSRRGRRYPSIDPTGRNLTHFLQHAQAGVTLPKPQRGDILLTSFSTPRRALPFRSPSGATSYSISSNKYSVLYSISYSSNNLIYSSLNFLFR